MEKNEWKHDPEVIRKIINREVKNKNKLPEYWLLPIALTVLLLFISISVFAADLKKAKIYFDDKNYDESLAIYESLSEDYGSNEDVLLGLYANYRMLNNARSFYVLNNLLELDGLSAEVATYSLDELELKKSIQEYPNEDIFYHQLALNQADKKTWKEVINLYQKASHLSDKVEYQLNLAIAYDRNQQYQKALYLYQKIDIENLNAINHYEVTNRIKELKDEIGTEAP